VLVGIDADDPMSQFRKTCSRHAADIPEPQDRDGSRLLCAAVILIHVLSIADATRYNGASTVAKVFVIFGTRPEAIKLAPVILALRNCPEISVRTCATAQHRELLDQVLNVFRIAPDYDLNLMRAGQSLAQSTAAILSSLEPILLNERPDIVLIQGDTTTTLCGALAAFYQRIPVGHVEAGLRTGDLFQPFPEEMNRVVASRLAELHFAATPWAAGNLHGEGVDAARVHVTGNSGIDAVLYIKAALEKGEVPAPAWPDWPPSRRLIVVTAHRRESFGEGFERICTALASLAARPDVQIVLPVHPNPNVREPIRRRLGELQRVSLIEPMEYVPFVDLMRRAHILITDSGGIQEEGPSLGKPVLVMREKTERPEAVEAGTVKLVGTDPQRIVAEAALLLDDAAEYERRSRVHNPYGDGHAAGRITAITTGFLRTRRL
jgi:UDP-N-acetylglucosamine 2-epimerase (non-hydrolysing)